MADWSDIKERSKRITKKLRAVRPANSAVPDHWSGTSRNDDMIRPFQDRIPRPTKVDLIAKPKAKKGREISTAQMNALKSGGMKIDARLDLHGMTQFDAYRELNHFMEKQTRRGARLLLIITGKGKNAEGILRANLPGWLMEGEFQNHILTIHPAHIRHGGDGATYVLLRRI